MSIDARSVTRAVFTLLMIVLIMALPLLMLACGPIQSTQMVAVTPLPAQGYNPTSTSFPVLAADDTNMPAPAPATPTPLSIQLPQGKAAAIAAATDVALQPTPRNRLAFAESPVPLLFEEFYDGYNIRKGLILSDKLVSLDGQLVAMQGYMAPPLKAELDFFVLTRIRLEFCPFCTSAADWPNDLVLVYMNGAPTQVTTRPIRLVGRLEVGQLVDPETGMFSLVRIYADEVEAL